MNKKPIIYRYVTQVSRFCKFLITKALRRESKAKMEEKLHLKRSEIDGQLGQFRSSNENDNISKSLLNNKYLLSKSHKQLLHLPKMNSVPFGIGQSLIFQDFED